MQLTARATRILQWFMPLLLVAWVAYGRMLVGAEVGWMSVITLMYAPIILVVLYLPPIITLFDREARAAKAVRHAYALTMWVMWALLFVFGLALPDAGDSGSLGSAMTSWGIPENVSGVIAWATIAGAAVCWLLAAVFASRGITPRYALAQED